MLQLWLRTGLCKGLLQLEQADIYAIYENCIEYLRYPLCMMKSIDEKISDKKRK
jgi:hypothetical protein